MLPINKKNISHKRILSVKTLSTYLTGFAITGSICFLPYPSHALSAAADTGSSYPGVGYGAQVLNIVLDTWENPDPTVEGITSITLRIANDGRPFSCEIRKFSSSQIADTSLCDTVAQIGTFPAPAMNQNSEITLTFVHEKKNILDSQNANINNQNLDSNIQQTENSTNNTKSFLNPNNNLVNPSTHSTTTPIIQESTNINPEIEKKENIQIQTNDTPQMPSTITTPQMPSTITTPQQEDIKITREEALMPPSENLILPAEAMKTYSQNLTAQVRKLINVPVIPRGKYKTSVRVDIDPKGVLRSSSIHKSSGQSKLDNEILRVLQQEIAYPPTPHNDHQSIWLTFIVQK